jgi:hypothetical protein
LLHPCGTIEKCQRGVHRDPARAENKHDQRDDEKREGSSGDKLVRIGKERKQGFAVPDYVGHDHVNGQDEAGNSGKQAQSEEDATTEFDASDEYRHLRGHRQAKAGEKLCHIWQVMEFAPAVLSKALTAAPLPANNPANAAPASMALVVFVIFKSPIGLE